MTHKSPYAWPSPPARAPQHTGQPGKLPARFRARRALKLAAVASVWVTGLAVVVIAVAMVAMTTAPSARTGQAASAGFTAGAAAGHASQAGQPAPHARAIRPARPAVTSLVFSGQGSANTTPFAIGGEGRWKVAWSYDCGGQAPGFTIRQTPAAAAGTAGLTVTRAGASGRGVAWAGHDPGQHALRIRTACAWHLAVTSYS
ncbi:MAG TPA: hypothetical protein VGQ05_17885 [Streptosporangiaceae bacterium]|jgi:hypothetical protein|nr:hypothetical protein [Streptosporangiaceae bacterium]